MSLHVIVLAAGKGTRMASDRAKVLHTAAGRPLITWVCELAAPLGATRTVVVVGHQAEEVAAVLPADVATALQAEQHGTGHAAEVGLAALDAEPGDTVVVLPGDMPLVRTKTLRRLVAVHREARAAATVLTTDAADPTGYGRVVRDGGNVVRIVEDRDATPEERAIHEVNTSVYAFRVGSLASALAGVSADNDQGERYLTDVIGILVAKGEIVAAVMIDEVEGMGVNTPAQLEAASAELVLRSGEER